MCRVVAGGAVRSDVRVYMGSGSLWRVNHLVGSCVGQLFRSAHRHTVRQPPGAPSKEEASGWSRDAAHPERRHSPAVAHPCVGSAATPYPRTPPAAAPRCVHAYSERTSAVPPSSQEQHDISGRALRELVARKAGEGYTRPIRRDTHTGRSTLSRTGRLSRTVIPSSSRRMGHLQQNPASIIERLQIIPPRRTTVVRGVRVHLWHKLDQISRIPGHPCVTTAPRGT